jgi:hypothetical protein
MNLPLQGLAATRRAIRICLLLAVGFALLAMFELRQTAPRAFKGRSAAMSEFLYSQFGNAGLAARWFVPVVVLLVAARSIWRHADRTPSDRWYRR